VAIIPTSPRRCNRCKEVYTTRDGHFRLLDVVFHERYNEYLCFDCFGPHVLELLGPYPALSTATESAEGRSTERYKEMSLESKKRDVHREDILNHSSRNKEVDLFPLSVDHTTPSCSTRRYLSNQKLQAITTILKIPNEFGKVFDCVVPTTERHSAVLGIESDGKEIYRCSTCNPKRALTFAEVFSLGKYGAVGRCRFRIGNIEPSRWWERLLYEAGLSQPAPVSMPLPDACTDHARIMACELQVLIGLRNSLWNGQPFPFARDFSMAWTGLNERRARAARDELECVGVLKAVARPPKGSRKPILWVLPGAVVHSEASWAFSKWT
jgi:hypothetical protein